jgi:hypothetical protein
MKDRDPIDGSRPTGRPEHSRGQSKRRHRAGSPHSEAVSAGPQVIARIPRLERPEEQARIEKPSDSRYGRLIGARFSAWALAGGSGLLVLVALSPFVLPRLFGSKSNSGSTTLETASRPDVPTPNATDAPRWSGASTAFDNWQPGDTSVGSPGTASGLNPLVASPGSAAGRAPEAGIRALEPPVAAVPAADPLATSVSPSWAGQPPFASSPRTSPAVAWQTVPGARSPEQLPGGALGSLPTSHSRPDADYRGVARGGLVNATPSTARETSPIEQRPDYHAAEARRNAAPAWPRLSETRSFGLAETEPRADRTPYAPADPRSDYRPGDARPDYRTATRSRYTQDAGPSGVDDRRMNYPEGQPPAAYPNLATRGGEMSRDVSPFSDYRGPQDFRSDVPTVGHPGRVQQASGYQAGGPVTGARPSMGTTPGYPADAAARAVPSRWDAPPNWASPPNRAWPPNWTSPSAVTPSQTSPPTGYSPSPYPATDYATENWASGSGAAGGPQGPAPAQRYPGGPF